MRTRRGSCRCAWTTRTSPVLAAAIAYLDGRALSPEVLAELIIAKVRPRGWTLRRWLPVGTAAGVLAAFGALEALEARGDPAEPEVRQEIHAKGPNSTLELDEATAKPAQAGGRVVQTVTAEQGAHVKLKRLEAGGAK